MKLYENYLFDESEKIVSDTHKDLAVEGLYKPDITQEDVDKNNEQCLIVECAFIACCHLMQLENIFLSTGGNVFYFSTVHSENERIQYESNSPYLSRNKLAGLKTFEVVNVICSMFLDREKWNPQQFISYKLSDGDGNWL